MRVKLFFIYLLIRKKKFEKINQTFSFSTLNVPDDRKQKNTYLDAKKEEYPTNNIVFSR